MAYSNKNITPLIATCSTCHSPFIEGDSGTGYLCDSCLAILQDEEPKINDWSDHINKD